MIQQESDVRYGRFPLNGNPVGNFFHEPHPFITLLIRRHTALTSRHGLIGVKRLLFGNEYLEDVRQLRDLKNLLNVAGQI